jgi:internalin A
MLPVFCLKPRFCLVLLLTSIFATFAGAKRLRVPEPGLEKALAETLGVPREELTEELVAKELRFLDAGDRQLRDLTGLEVAENLEVLVLRQNLIEDVSPLADLPNLVKLDLSSNRIKNLSALKSLSLDLMRTEISQIQVALQSRTLPKDEKVNLIVKLTEVVKRINRGTWSLQILSVSNNKLLGLSGVGHLTSLRHLDVSRNSLIDLEGVGQLKNLITLSAQSNQLGRVESYVDVDKDKAFTPGIDQVKDESGNGKRDTDPLVELRTLPNLINLYLYDNLLKNTLSLSALPSLKFLLLSGNQLDEIDNLSEFKSLIRLALSDNRITTLDGLEGLPKIEHLYLEENLICDLRPLGSLSSLQELRLQRNQVYRIHSMKDLRKLRVLALSNNFIHDLAPILDLPKLKRLSLSSNCIALDGPILVDKFKQMRRSGVLISEGSQRKRIVEAEQLFESLVGRPSSNKILGEFLREKNKYDRLIDLAEDAQVPDPLKKISYKNWDDLLRRGKLDEVTFLLPGN